MRYPSMLFAVLPALAVAAALADAPPAAAQTVVTQVPATSSTTTSTVIIAPSAPPPVQVETVPVAPSTTMIWQPGHWAYTNSNWTWIPGQYAAPPQQMTVWDPGHWVQQPTGGYVWMEGRWRTSGG